MIFNCEACGKSISSKRELCPYCRCDTAEFSLLLERKAMKGQLYTNARIEEKLRGTFAGVGM